MTNPPIPSKGAYRPIKNHSKNSPSYESDLLQAIVHLYNHVYTRRDIELKHRSNRSLKRNSNKNEIVKNVSIVDLMKEFLVKKDLYDAYTKPQELMFYRKAYRSYTGPIKFTTLYTSFNNLKSSIFHKKFPNITFKNLLNLLNAHGLVTLTEQELIDDYDVIMSFINTF